MSYLRVKNWSEFQHYKDRAPPWIKLHRSLLEDYEFSLLPDAAKAHLMMIWLFAAGNDGRIPSDARFLARKLATTDDIDLKLLIDKGFLEPEQLASNPLAECKQPASNPLALTRSREAEAETEEKEHSPAARPALSKADPMRAFDRWWSAYPRKASKGDAEKAWRSLKPDDVLTDRIVQATQVAARRDQWQAENGRFIPYPATWLRAKGWEDEDLQPRANAMPWWRMAGYGSLDAARADGVEAPA